MTGKSQNRVESERDDQLDRILDAALGIYAAVEPRNGLEDRVLANLRANEAPAPSNAGRWQWAAATAAAGIVVAMFAWRPDMPSHRLIANHAGIIKTTVTAPGAQTAKQLAFNGNGESTHGRAHATAERPHHADSLAAATPKLDVFPSPQPLSEQEKLLANYVAHFHDQAVLIARARAEELLKDREEDATETGSIHTDLDPASN